MIIRTKLINVSLALCLMVFLFQPLNIYAQDNPNANVEAVVHASFPDMPDMITIAKCESGFRQFASDGSVLRGGTGSKYIGIFQFNEAIHTPQALSMAYDLKTVDGNIAYARYVYLTSGTGAWKGCLASVIQPSTLTPIFSPSPTPVPSPTQTSENSSATISGALTINLKLGTTDEQVISLQQILNKNGFPVASFGVGSPGNETKYFGSLTREAVKKFQCAKGIACDGNELTTGYGRVGPMTREQLNKFVK